MEHNVLSREKAKNFLGIFSQRKKAAPRENPWGGLEKNAGCYNSGMPALAQASRVASSQTLA